MTYTDRGWRFMATALLWFFFGAIGIVVGFIFLPLVNFFIRDPQKRQATARSVIGRAFGTFVAGGKVLGAFEVNIDGLENYDPDHSQLILANHPTLIDVVILISLFPQVDCVVKEAVMRNPFMRGAVRPANYVSNREPGDLLDTCVNRLRGGSSLLLFPEGTRTVRGQAIQLKLGAAEIAVRARADILPVAIDCSPQFLTKEDPWYWIPASRPVFSIKVMSTVAAANLANASLDDRHARYALNESLAALFEAQIA